MRHENKNETDMNNKQMCKQMVYVKTVNNYLIDKRKKTYTHIHRLCMCVQSAFEYYI